MLPNAENNFNDDIFRFYDHTIFLLFFLKSANSRIDINEDRDREGQKASWKSQRKERFLIKVWKSEEKKITQIVK